MRPGQQQQNKQRMRGRGRKGPNPMSRSYESNGPDVKIRGTAQHIAEKYSTLARDSAASGDRVMAENYLQHAEHYGRIVAAAQGTFQLQQDENDYGDQNDDDGDEDNGSESAYAGGNANGNGGQDERAPFDRNQNDRNQGERGQNDRNNDRNQGERNGQQHAAREGRDQRGNRDGNRDNRGNRDDNRGNRDGNRENRDGNREFQGRDRDNRDGNRGHRERPALNGLGPQPVVSEPRGQAQAGDENAPRNVVQDQPRNMGHEQASPPPAAEVASAEAAPREEFRPRNDEPRAEGEPRRRGRPRRVRNEEGEPRAQPAADVSAGTSDVPAATTVAAPAIEPVTAVAPVAPPAATKPERPKIEASPAEGDAEVKVKRKPGRPRKKKPEDDSSGGDGGDDHLPAFLMASNT